MIIDLEDLRKIRKENRYNSKVIFCSGAFNLFHPGHLKFLNKCGSLGDILIVAVASDWLTTKTKRKPLLIQELRMNIVDSIKYVDYVIPEPDLDAPENLREILENLKPDIWVMNSDTPFPEEYKGLSAELEVPLLMLEREKDGISTTEIIRRIKES